MKSRDTCIFYRSFFEAIEMLNSDEEKATIYNAIFNYSLNFKKPELSGNCLMIWKLIFPVLEKGNINYINGSKPKEKAKPKRIRSETEAKPKRNRSGDEAYKDKDKYKEKDKDKEKDFLNYKKWTTKDFVSDIDANKEKYTSQMLKDFYNYWSEKDAQGKMRFQLQKTWETKRRLITWSNNNFKNNSSNDYNNSTVKNLPSWNK